MVAEMAADECAYGNSARGGVKREGLHGWPRARTVRTESADILARRSAQASSAADAACLSAEAEAAVVAAAAAEAEAEAEVEAEAEAEVEAEAEDCTAPGKAVVKEWDNSFASIRPRTHVNTNSRPNVPPRGRSAPTGKNSWLVKKVQKQTLGASMRFLLASCSRILALRSSTTAATARSFFHRSESAVAASISSLRPLVFILVFGCVLSLLTV